MTSDLTLTNANAVCNICVTVTQSHKTIWHGEIMICMSVQTVY